MVILFVYAPYVYWKKGAHRNAKLVFHWYCWLVVPQYSIAAPAISCLIMLQVLQHAYLPPMCFLFFSHAPCTPCYHVSPMPPPIPFPFYYSMLSYVPTIPDVASISQCPSYTPMSPMHPCSLLCAWCPLCLCYVPYDPFMMPAPYHEIKDGRFF